MNLSRTKSPRCLLDGYFVQFWFAHFVIFMVVLEIRIETGDITRGSNE